MNKTLSLLTICAKAGKLKLGMDPVKDVCRSHEASCVLVASDVSPKSLKEVKFFCRQENIKIFALDATIGDVWGSLGKKAGIIGILDRGFTKKLSTMLTIIDNE